MPELVRVDHRQHGAPGQSAGDRRRARGQAVGGQTFRRASTPARTAVRFRRCSSDAWACGPSSSTSAPRPCPRRRPIEELGYPALWLPEAVGREPLFNGGLLLGATERIVVATGIASIWARDADDHGPAQLTLSEAFPGRFLLGLGVSHQPMVDFVRGHALRQAAHEDAELPRRDGQRALRGAPPGRGAAAGCSPRSGPKMLELAAGQGPRRPPVLRAGRAHRVRPRGARRRPDAVPRAGRRARHRSRGGAGRGPRSTWRPTSALPNYTNNLRRLGWGDDDLADGGSDALVDAIVAWGDEDAIVARVQAHLDAGADHVCVQVLDSDAAALPMPQWRALAPALLSLRNRCEPPPASQ